MDHRQEWSRAAEELTKALGELGYPEEFARVICKSLQSPKAIRRMTGYLKSANPASTEMIVDEMLAIQSEVEAWRKKKAAEEANARLRWRDWNLSEEHQ